LKTFLDIAGEGILEGLFTQDDIDEMLSQLDNAGQQVNEKVKDLQNQRASAMKDIMTYGNILGYLKTDNRSMLIEFLNNNQSLVEELAGQLDLDLTGLTGMQAAMTTAGVLINDTNATIEENWIITKLLNDSTLAWEDLGNQINEAGGDINDFSLIQESLNSLTDEQLEATFNGLQDQYAMQEKILDLNQENLETEELAAKKQEELLPNLETQLATIDELLDYMRENNFLQFEIDKWEMKRLDILGQINTLEAETTEEMEAQNEQADQMDSKLRAMLQRRQQLQLQAVEQGGWTPELLTQFQSMGAQILQYGADEGYDVSQLGIDVEAIPKFHDGGPVLEDTLAFLKAGEYVLPNITGMMQGAGVGTTTNNSNASVVQNNVYNVSGYTGDELTNGVKAVMENESLPMLQTALRQVGMTVNSTR
jgi:hypothetical protein